MRRATAGAAGIALGCAGALSAVWATPPLVLTPPAQANYMLNCMGCHLPDGSGAAGKVPSIRESLPLLATSDAGRRYLVQVPGSARSPLSDRELAQLLSWMVRNLGVRAAPAGFSDFTEAEVAAYRGAPLIDVGATRTRLLAASAAIARP
jgi:mono/diheme cytochrome c family protein